MNELIQFIDFHYGIKCLLCNCKVLDPDKKKGQIYLQGKCPTCGGDSDNKKHKQNTQINHNHGKSKRQLKRERRAQAKAERNEAKRSTKNR